MHGLRTSLVSCAVNKTETNSSRGEVPIPITIFQICPFVPCSYVIIAAAGIIFVIANLRMIPQLPASLVSHSVTAPVKVNRRSKLGDGCYHVFLDVGSKLEFMAASCLNLKNTQIQQARWLPLIVSSVLHATIVCIVSLHSNQIQSSNSDI